MPITRYFGLLDESDYNEAFGSPALIYLDVGEVNITPEQSPEDIPTSTFNAPTRVILGDFGLSGTINTVADTDLFGYILGGVCGNCNKVTGTGTEYQHMFWTLGPRGNGNSNLLSYKLGVGEDLLSLRKISGVVFNSVDFTFNRSGSVEVVANVLCANEVIGTYGDETPAVGSYPADSNYIFTGSRLEVYIGLNGGSHTQIQLDTTGEPTLEALSMTINNNITDDWRGMGSRFLANYTPQLQEITGSMTLGFASSKELQRYFGGGESPSATTPADRYKTFPLMFMIDLGVQIDSTLNYKFGVYLPKVYYTSYGKAQTGRDRTTIDIGFKALMPLETEDYADSYSTGDLYDFDSDRYIKYGAVDFMPTTDAYFDSDTETAREIAACYMMLYNGQNIDYRPRAPSDIRRAKLIVKV